MISIIVPIYNVAPYLPSCLDSLVNQTYRDLEIICVNDGSTDGSLPILKEYAKKDERIKVINQANQGLSGARNTGIKAAQGEWMMFVDSDDWLDLTACEQLLDAVTQGKDVGFCSYIRESSRGSHPQYIFDEQPRAYDAATIHSLYTRLIAPTGTELAHPEKLDSLSTAWGKIYRTSIIQEHRLEFVSTKEIGTEDLLFNVHYFRWIQSAVYVPAPLYHYRKNNITSLTKLYKPRLSEQWNVLFQKIEECITPLHRPELEQALQYRRALCLIGQGLNLTFSNKGLLEKRKELSTILHAEFYRHAIQVLPLNYFPLHWKIFYGMAKYKCTWGILLLLLIMKRKISQ